MSGTDILAQIPTIDNRIVVKATKMFFLRDHFVPVGTIGRVVDLVADGQLYLVDFGLPIVARIKPDSPLIETVNLAQELDALQQDVNRFDGEVTELEQRVNGLGQRINGGGTDNAGIWLKALGSLPNADPDELRDIIDAHVNCLAVAWLQASETDHAAIADALVEPGPVDDAYLAGLLDQRQTEFFARTVSIRNWLAAQLRRGEVRL